MAENNCCGQYLWIAATDGIFAFWAAFGIGANDVANAFATSVGSKAITLRRAIIVAAIFEFSGAVLLGGGVASTIMTRITDRGLFADNPELLMIGMLCTEFATAIWLTTASWLGLPVSTTHSVIGGIIGFTLVANGIEGLKIGQLVRIIVSWFASPVLSGCIAGGLFFVLRAVVLRQESSMHRALRTYPVVVSATVAINGYYIFYYGPAEDPSWLPEQWQGMLIAVAAAILMSFILQFTFIRYYLEPTMLAWKANALLQHRRPSDVIYSSAAAEDKNVESPSETTENKPGFTVPSRESDGDSSDRDAEHASIASQVAAAVDPHASLQDSESTASKIHAHGERFDPATEHTFTYLQVFTACVSAFGHGANDVANAIAPFATTLGLYLNANVGENGPIPDADVPIWILAFGGAGIVVGLAVLGYRVIRSIGVELIKVTPARGFVIELSSASVIILGSVLGMFAWLRHKLYVVIYAVAGIPLSTTHCQVGAEVGVGALEGKNGVNWRLLVKVFGAWVFTIAITGSISAALYSFAVFSPSRSGYEGTRPGEL